MKLNAELHKTKQKNAKVKNSGLIQMANSIICLISFLCFMGIFPSLKFDSPNAYIYNNRNMKLFW